MMIKTLTSEEWVRRWPGARAEIARLREENERLTEKDRFNREFLRIGAEEGRELRAKLEECRASLGLLELHWKRDGEDSSESYDRVASLFHKETGYMAPGKDVAAAMNPSKEDMDERQPAWDKWCASHIAQARRILAEKGGE